MSEDVIKDAKEIRRRIINMEVTRTIHSDLSELRILTEALDGLLKAEEQKNNYLITQNAMKIVNSYSKLALHEDIEITDGLYKKYNKLVEHINQCSSYKENLKQEIENEKQEKMRLNQMNEELVSHNKTLVIAIDRLTEKLEQLGIRLDENKNPLSS